MLKVLENRKEVLEETLQRKLEELKIICLKEGELTGELPPETPLIDGKPCPQIRKRVGTSFAFSDKLTVNSTSKEKEALAKMELEYEIQSKITTASLKLANDVNTRKSVRKQRQMSYQQASAKLQEVQHKLLSMKRQVEAMESLESKSFDNNNDTDESRLAHLSNDNGVFCETGIISCDPTVKSVQLNGSLMSVSQNPLCTPLVASPYTSQKKKSSDQDIVSVPLDVTNPWNCFQSEFQSSNSFPQVVQDGGLIEKEDGQYFQNGKYSGSSTPHNQSFYSTSSEESTLYNDGRIEVLRRSGNRFSSGGNGIITSLYNSSYQPTLHIENQESLFCNVNDCQSVTPRGCLDTKLCCCQPERHPLKSELCSFEHSLSDCPVPAIVPTCGCLSLNKSNDVRVPCKHEGPVIPQSVCDQDPVANQNTRRLNWLTHPVPHDTVYTSCCCCCSAMNCSNSLCFNEPDYTHLVEMHITEPVSNGTHDKWKAQGVCVRSVAGNNFMDKESQVILDTPDCFVPYDSPGEIYPKSNPLIQSPSLVSQNSLTVSTASLSKSPSKAKTKEWIETLLDSPLPPKKNKLKETKSLNNELVIQVLHDLEVHNASTVPNESNKEVQQSLQISRECLSSPSPPQFLSSSPLPSPKPKLSPLLPRSYQSASFSLQQDNTQNSLASKASEILLSLSPTTPYALQPGTEVSVVTVGHFQPYWEETKPYELSDFYKYSKKHRKQQTTKQSENNASGNDVAKIIPEIKIDSIDPCDHEEVSSIVAENGDTSLENEEPPCIHVAEQSTDDNQPSMESEVPPIEQSVEEEFFIGECDPGISLAEAFHDEMLAWYEDQGTKKATLV